MKKVLFYAALISAAFLLQNNLFAASPLIRTTPNLLLIVTFATAFIAGPKEGMVVGFFSGLLLDSFFGGTIGFYALIYMTVGYINGFFGTFFYREFVTTPIVLSLVSDLAFGTLVYIFGFLLKGRLNFPAYLIGIILPEAVYTTLVTFVIYKPLFAIEEKAFAAVRRSAKHFV